MKAPEWTLNPRVKPTEEPATEKAPPVAPTPRARYDAARSGSENRIHWAQADALSPNAATNHADRKILRERARYEVANNPFAFGAANAIAEDCIGTGPRLQMMLGENVDDASVRALEDLWQQWADEVGLGDTLRLLYRAQAVDGEGLALISDNPKLNHPVKLQLRPFEADRLTHPFGQPINEPNNVDGIEFDAHGNPIRYNILRHHPGDNLTVSLAIWEWDVYPASQVYHLFRADRCGQARGVSWLTPALPLFAQLRRYTLAVLLAAETAANIAGVLKTDTASPDGEPPSIETMDQVPIPRNALLTLPAGWDASSFQGTQPTQTFGDFRTQILVEIGRVLDMPLNRITGNSSGYNYSSGRLDHLGYQKGVWVQRDKLRLVILDRLFRAWIDEALLAGAVPAGLPPMSEWAWDWQWDAFGDIDPLKESKAAAQLLELNLTDLAEQCAARGRRWDQVLHQRAREMAMMKELGLPLTTEPTPPPGGGGPDGAPTLEDMAAAAGLSLVPLACGGEGGTPGPCPEGGQDKDEPASTPEREQEDADLETERDQEDEDLDKARAEEDYNNRAERAKEDDATYAERQQEDEERVAEREDEDEGYAPEEDVQKARDAEDHDIKLERAKEDQKTEAERAKQDKELEQFRKDEDKNIDADRAKEDKQIKDFRLKEDKQEIKPKKSRLSPFKAILLQAKGRRLARACGGEGSGVPGPCPGGGAGEAPADHEKQDEEIDARQEKEREDLGAQHEKENVQVEKERAKEDRTIDRDRERADGKEERATERAVEKAKENIQKESEKREKETPSYKEWQKQVDQHGEQSKEAKDAYDKHVKDFLDKEDKKTLEKQNEAEKSGEKHLEEHRQQQSEKHGKEDAQRQEKRQAEDKTRGDRQSREGKDLDKKHEGENRAIEEKRKAGKAMAAFRFRRARACGGEGSGVPGPCPGGGDGTDKGASDKHAETHDKWEAEDADRQAAHDDKVADAEQKGQDKIDKVTDRHERENEKVENTREKEDARVETTREKEDNALEKTRYQEDKAIEKAQEKEDLVTEKDRAKEANDLQDKRDAEDEAIAERHEAEDETIAERREKEPEKEEGQWSREDKETSDRRAEEAKENVAARDKEDKEIAERIDKEDEDSTAQRDKESVGLAEKREAEDQKVLDDRANEDAAREQQREKEDEERSARQGAELKEQEKKYDAAIADLERKHEETERAVQKQREKDNPDASKDFYKSGKAQILPMREPIHA